MHLDLRVLADLPAGIPARTTSNVLATDPSGTGLLLLVKCLAIIEYGWFCVTFGQRTEPLRFCPDDEDSAFRVEPHESTADIVAFYRRALAPPLMR